MPRSSGVRSDHGGDLSFFCDILREHEETHHQVAIRAGKKVCPHINKHMVGMDGGTPVPNPTKKISNLSGLPSRSGCSESRDDDTRDDDTDQETLLRRDAAMPAAPRP
jgi:hypothetical protein